MKLTKQLVKKVMATALVLTSMTGMVFASGSNEVTSSPVISGEQSWTGVIDGIAIDLSINSDNNSLEGSATNLTNGDLSMVTLYIDNASGTNMTSLTLGTPGDLEFHETMIKENTIVFGGGSSVPVMFYMSESQMSDILNSGWTVSIDSDNAPKYGLFEKGELIAKNATPLANSFIINENGVQTVVDFSYEDEGFSGTVTNYTNKTVNAVETTIVLNNGEVFTFNTNDIQAGATVSFSYGSGVSGFSSYAVETIVK